MKDIDKSIILMLNAAFKVDNVINKRIITKFENIIEKWTLGKNKFNYDKIFKLNENKSIKELKEIIMVNAKKISKIMSKEGNTI